MRRGQQCVFFLLLATALCLCIANVDAGITLQPPVKLKWHYYRQHTTCTYAEEFVRHQVELFWKADRSITAKLLRLLYSDCFVTVCLSQPFNLILRFFLPLLFGVFSLYQARQAILLAEK